MEANVIKQLRKEAEGIWQSREATVAQYEADIARLKSEIAQREAALGVALRAKERCENYSAVKGNDYTCPRCWMNQRASQTLTPITGNAAVDRFRCHSCGTDYDIAL